MEIVYKLYANQKFQKMKTIAIEDCERIGDKLYFIDKKINLVYCMGIMTGEIVIIGSMPEEKIFSNRLGAKIIHYNNSLYFSPMYAKKIWKYNLNTLEWTGYERKNLPNWTNDQDMFQAVLWHNKIFFIGSHYPAIIVFDLETDSMEYIVEPYCEIYKTAEAKMDACFRTDYVQIGDVIYMASCVTNEVFMFNLESYEYNYIEVGNKNYSYSGIDYDGELFYLSPRKNGPIIVWDGKKIIREISISSIYGDKDIYIFGGVVCKNNEVYFPSCFHDYSLVLENKSDYNSLRAYKEKYHFYKKIDPKTYVKLNSCGCMCIDFGSKKYSYDLSIERDIISEWIRRNGKYGEIMDGYFFENESINLKDLLCVVK